MNLYDANGKNLKKDFFFPHPGFKLKMIFMCDVNQPQARPYCETMYLSNLVFKMFCFLFF